MQEITFLGFSKSEWDFFNSFANWASAAGSFAAALVALHLANRISRPRAKVRVGNRIMVGTGNHSPYPEFINFRIVNSGDRNFRVTQLGWRVGAIKKREALQMFEPTMSSPPPIELSHGQEANWFVPLKTDRRWADHFSKKFIMQERSGWLASSQAYIAIRSLRAVFTTSLGDEFVTKPEDNLLKVLRAACLSPDEADKPDNDDN